MWRGARRHLARGVGHPLVGKLVEGADWRSPCDLICQRHSLTASVCFARSHPAFCRDALPTTRASVPPPHSAQFRVALRLIAVCCRLVAWASMSALPPRLFPSPPPSICAPPSATATFRPPYLVQIFTDSLRFFCISFCSTSASILYTSKQALVAASSPQPLALCVCRFRSARLVQRGCSNVCSLPPFFFGA